jgi:hypothetical protein
LLLLNAMVVDLRNRTKFKWKKRKMQF